jgi:putative endopeptidase
MIKKLLVPVAAISLLTACTNNSGQAVKKGDILVTNMDSTANPADDFFEYANGAWLKANDIPASESSWGIAHLVNEELYNRKRTINEEAAAKKGATGVDKLIGDFWKTAMDSAKAEQQGLSPIKPVLDRINNMQTPAEVMQTTAYLHTIGCSVFFTEGVTQDARNSELMSYQLHQGGLGLPNRDYYFNTDKRSVVIRTAYPAFVNKMLQATGVDAGTAESRANAVVALETRLAKVSRKLEDLRDPYKNYNKMSVAGLSVLSPGIDWPATFTNIGMPKMDTIIIGQPEFYKELGAIIKTTPLQTLKDYMAYQLVNDMAAYLNKSIVDADFDFYGRILKGAKEQRPRWKRVLDAEEGAMGEALGKLFAAEYFNETAKKRYTDIVENVRNAYRLRLEKLDWMGDSTRQKALAKLASIKKKVGYPDKWKDFSAMKIGTESYAANMMAANEWWHKYQISKYGKPVDRDEWEMTPQTYNAYYNPSNNEIVLPAGIFTVPGYRDEELDDALVYGYAAASTIGHEITHGFDDEGRQFDDKGNLQSWWTKQDEAQFTKKAAVLVQQFNNIVAVDSLHINGRASLGENLADLGGVLIGIDAFKNTEAYKKGEKINGLTPLQRFFQGYALGWLYKQRQEELASRILTDVHSPAKWRVNGIFPNVPAFYEAYDIKPGSKMYLPDSARVKLW